MLSSPMAAAAAAPAKDATPPPVIGRAGRYTVFITPPPTSDSPNYPSPIPHKTPRNPSPLPTAKAPPPPVQVPPKQFDKPAPSGSLLGFFRDAVAKVQDAHASLDEHLADWLGLNQSKYQWAINDYYETTGGGGGTTELPFVWVVLLSTSDTGCSHPPSLTAPVWGFMLFAPTIPIQLFPDPLPPPEAPHCWCIPICKFYLISGERLPLSSEAHPRSPVPGLLVSKMPPA